MPVYRLDASRLPARMLCRLSGNNNQEMCVCVFVQCGITCIHENETQDEIDWSGYGQ